MFISNVDETSSSRQFQLANQLNQPINEQESIPPMYSTSLSLALLTRRCVLIMLIGCGVPVLLSGCHAAPQETPSGVQAGSGSSVGAWRVVDVPAGPGSLAPELGWNGDAPLLSWLDPRSEEVGGGHRLRFASWTEGAWGEPQNVIESENLFANWADRPQLQELPDGGLVASWLETLGDDTYAYGVQWASTESPSQGPWVRRGLLHDDASASEHGFVSWLPSSDGLRAFWLDGRQMPSGGDMQLRTTWLDPSQGSSDATSPGTPPVSTLLDDRVCECCATDSALGADGPLVVYRDRSSEEVRNISIVRWTTAGWSPPQQIHDDGWKIAGCPVNGPVVGADGQRVAVAWFTVVDGASRLNLAWSDDAGATFGTPRIVDADEPLGRMDLAMQGDDSAWLSWLATTEGGAEVRVQRHHADGRHDPAMSVAKVSGQRSGGVPRLLADGQRLYVVWRQDGEDAGLRSAVMELSSGG